MMLFLFGAWYDYTHKDEAVAYHAARVDSTVPLPDFCAGKYVLFATNFKASFDNQTVVSWTENRSPTALEGCAVASSKDWQCHNKKDQYSNTITMSDAEYLETGPLKPYPTFTIGKWHYRWLVVKTFLQPYLKKK